jgi:STAS domain
MTRGRPDRPERVFNLEGVLDIPAATKLRDAIMELDPTDRVIVDCHEVRDLQDSAFAFLVWSLFSRGRRIVLRGLGEHHLRLLRYLGVERMVVAGSQHPPGNDAR